MVTLNPLTLRGDSRVTSPYNIHPISSKWVTRILQIYQAVVLILIEHQIRATNLQGNV